MQAEQSNSAYMIEVHTNLFLDAQSPHHWEGRYINDGRRSNRQVNARFGARRRTTTHKPTGMQWVSVFATRKIPAGTEIFLDYSGERRGPTV